MTLSPKNSGRTSSSLSSFVEFIICWVCLICRVFLVCLEVGGIVRQGDSDRHGATVLLRRNSCRNFADFLLHQKLLLSKSKTAERISVTRAVQKCIKIGTRKTTWCTNVPRFPWPTSILFRCGRKNTQHQQPNNSMVTSDEEVTSDEDEDPPQQEPTPVETIIPYKKQTSMTAQSNRS